LSWDAKAIAAAIEVGDGPANSRPVASLWTWRLATGRPYWSAKAALVSAIRPRLPTACGAAFPQVAIVPVRHR